MYLFLGNIPRNVDDSVDLERVDTTDVLENEVIEALQAHARRQGDVETEDACARALAGDNDAMRRCCWTIDDIQEHARKYSAEGD